MSLGAVQKTVRRAQKLLAEDVRTPDGVERLNTLESLRQPS
jgi:hypothetical protein